MIKNALLCNPLRLLQNAAYCVSLLFCLQLMIQTVGAATITVNSVADDLTAGNGACTLREAVRNANNDMDFSSGDCVAGAGFDVINLPANATITLALGGADSGVGALVETSGDLDLINPVTINGNGSTINAANIDRVFQIERSPLSFFSVTINDLIMTGGNPKGVTSQGGAIWVRSAGLTLNNCLINANTTNESGSYDNGGGLSVTGTTTVTAALNLNNSIVSGNSGANGGGINVLNATVTMSNSTVSGNSATGPSGGGGIMFAAGVGIPTTMTVNNSTFSGNQTNVNGGGALIFSGQASFNHVTVAGNTADSDSSGDGSGGGVATGSSGTLVFNLKNSLVADNTDLSAAPAAPDCFTNIAVNSQDYNLIENASGCTITGATANNITGVDPQLAALANNGGAAPTRLFAHNSVVVDAIPSGVNDCGTTITSDQRGSSRATDSNADGAGRCEIGAVELGGLQCSIQAAGEPFAYNYLSGANLVSVNVTNDGANFECLRVTDIATNHPNADSTMKTGKYWIISALQADRTTTATADYTVDLTLPFAAADGGDKLCRYSGGGNWDCARSSHVANNSITRTGVTQFSDWTIQNLSATAASVSVGGRVLQGKNRGLYNAYVILTDAGGNVRTAVTNPFGYYRFDDVTVGETYVFQIYHKRSNFVSQIYYVGEETNNLNFDAQP